MVTTEHGTPGRSRCERWQRFISFVSLSQCCGPECRAPDFRRANSARDIASVSWKVFAPMKKLLLVCTLSLISGLTLARAEEPKKPEAAKDAPKPEEKKSEAKPEAKPAAVKDVAVLKTSEG